MSTYIFPFQSLNNSELSGVFGGSVLEFSRYVSKKFEFNEAYSVSDAFPEANHSEIPPFELDCSYYDINTFNQYSGLFGLENDKLFSLYFNIRSIPSNLEYFKAEFNYSIFDTISFSETRLTADIEALYKLDEYNHFFNNRNSRGGGVAIYARKFLSPEFITNLSIVTSSIETVFIKLVKRGKTYIYGNVYRPPNSNIQNFLNEMSRILDELTTYSSCTVTIGGDFNLDLFKIDENRAILDYYSLFVSNNYRPIINRPTRVGRNSATLIDHIWSNSENRPGHSSGIIQSGVSDHFPCFYNLVCEEDRSENRYVSVTYRNKSSANREIFREKLRDADWSQMRLVGDLDEMYNIFDGKLSKIFEESFPLKTKNLKKLDIEKPYFTESLKQLIREKHRLEKLYFKRPIMYESEYKRIRNKANREVKLARKKYFSNKFERCQGDRKTTWNIVNDILGRSVGGGVVVEELLVDGETVTGDANIANSFNTYFSEVGQMLANNFTGGLDFDAINQTLNFPTREIFKFKSINNHDVTKVVSSLNNSSAGHDNISANMVKDNIDIDNASRRL